MKVIDNCYDEHKTESGEVASLSHEVEKGVFKRLILSDKHLDFWGSNKLTNMISNFKPAHPDHKWHDDMLMIVKPTNERRQFYMNNTWTAFYYTTNEDLEANAKAENISTIEWVRKYCDGVRKSHVVKYVD